MKRLVGLAALAMGLMYACTVPGLPENLPCAEPEPGKERCLEGYVCVEERCVEDDGSTDGGPDGGSDGGCPESVKLTLQLQPELPEAPDGGPSFSYVDPREPQARHRDKTAVVRVLADRADVDAASLSVSVSGLGEGPPFSTTEGSGCAAAPFCKDVTVPLWAPPLDAFRGEFTVTASVRAATGGTCTESRSFPVTRWKWSFDGAAGPIQTSPAIGAGGIVYFGTSSADGRVFALEPEGRVRWSKKVGEVTTGPLVGGARDGGERVYVGVDATAVTAAHGNVLYALSSNSGALVGDAGCPRTNAEFRTPLALTAPTRMTPETADFETVATLSEELVDGAAKMLAFRPDAEESRRCVPRPVGHISFRDAGSMVAVGADVYFASEPGLYGYRFGSQGWIEKPGFTHPNVNWGECTGLAVSRNSTYLVGAGSDDHPREPAGAVVSFLVSDGAAGPSIPPVSGKHPIRNLVLGIVDGGVSEVAYVGHDEAAGELKALSLSNNLALLRTGPGAGRISNAPVLGASGKLYTASSGPAGSWGEVREWNASTLALRWREGDTIAAVAEWPASGSPALDCARPQDGGTHSDKLGTLYVPGGNGVLHAIIVDSPGLDTNAAWPHFQHDARNTGNPATPLSCP